MVWTSLLMIAIVAEERPIEPRVVAASLFKNGYAVVKREVPLQDAEVLIEPIPNAVPGTLWFTASNGVRIEQIVSQHREIIERGDVQSLSELLTRNVGKEATCKYLMGNELQTVTATILSVTNGTVIFQRAGEIIAVPPGAVAQVSGPGLEWKAERKSRKPVVRVRASGPSGSKIVVWSVEQGLTWAPSYSVDISDPKKLHLIQKAVVLNDLSALDDIEIRLITGFPNLIGAPLIDPMTLQVDVATFIASLARAAQADAMAPGAAGQWMLQNAADGQRARRFDEVFEVQALPGLQAEDLFFYRLPKVKLGRNERGYYVLQSFETPYEHRYEWDVQSQTYDDPYYQQTRRPEQAASEEVWHQIEFKNAGDQPLTTAPAITIQGGQLLGQDTLRYTSVGEAASLKITKALDVWVNAEEIETSRERKVVSYGGIQQAMDEITLKGTLRIRNTKREAIQMRIRKELTGELLSATGNPESVALGKGARAYNPRYRLTWQPTVKAGEKLELAYTFKILIRV